MSKVITCDTPSHTSDHLYQIWKESIENCRLFFKVKTEKFQKFAKNSNFPILKKRNMWHTLMIMFICAKYKNNPPRTVDATELTRFFKSRSNDLEDIGQGQRSSHVTHLLMLVIICTKYGKSPTRTVDVTERTRFSRPRPNDLEDMDQGQIFQFWKNLNTRHTL